MAVNTLNKLLMQGAISAFICLLFFAFTPSLGKAQAVKEEKPAVNFPQASQFANSKFTYKIILAPENTFGYDILKGKILSSVTPNELKKLNIL